MIWETIYRAYDELTQCELIVGQLENGKWFWHVEDHLQDPFLSCGDTLYATAKEAKQAAEQAYEQWIEARNKAVAE
jgi:hypothetical protein